MLLPRQQLTGYQLRLLGPASKLCPGSGFQSLRVVFYRKHQLSERIAAWARGLGLAVGQRVAAVVHKKAKVYFIIPDNMTISNLKEFVGSKYKLRAFSSAMYEIILRDDANLNELEVD